jgi:hypothetical protein
MSTLSLLTDAELDTVAGGDLCFPPIAWVALVVQDNLSRVSQGQVNVSSVSLLSTQGGAQIAQVSQVNRIG